MPCDLGRKSVLTLTVALVWLLIAANGARAAARATTRVPSVVGLDLGHAYARLHQAGFRVTYPRSFSAGSLSCAPVIGKQRPVAGTLSRLATVTLTPQPPRCAAPSLALPTGPLPSALVPRFAGQPLLVAARWAITNELYWQVNRLPALRNGCWPQLLGNYAIVRQSPRAGAILKLGIARHHGDSGSFLPTPLKLTARQRGCSSAPPGMDSQLTGPPTPAFVLRNAQPGRSHRDGTGHQLWRELALPLPLGESVHLGAVMPRR